MLRKYKKTNLFVVDEDLWKWSKYNSEMKGYDSVSEYIFELIKKDKDKVDLETIRKL